LLRYGTEDDQKKQGLDFAISAFNVHKSPAAMLEIILVATRFAHLRPLVDDFCKKYSDSFAKEKDIYAKDNGYRLKIEAARLAVIHLEQAARAQNDRELANVYIGVAGAYADERDTLYKRW